MPRETADRLPFCAIFQLIGSNAMLLLLFAPLAVFSYLLNAIAPTGLSPSSKPLRSGRPHSGLMQVNQDHFSDSR